MLVGRTAECARLADLVDGARTGHSAALVVRGEAGIGKTSLLGYAESVARDLTRLHTQGIETERELPYVGLADLFRPVTDHLDRIPERQAAALTGALALGPAVAQDRFAVAAGTLSLLGAISESGPVLVVVDDTQWLDPYSLDALAFATRRLGREGVVALFATRDTDETASRLAPVESLSLHGLDAGAARELVAEEAAEPLPPHDVQWLLSEARGNPLALVELPALIAHGGHRPDSGAPLPIGDILARTFHSAITRLPDPTRDAMLLLAVLGPRPLAGTERVLRAHELTYADLEPAERAGLMTVEGGAYIFRHPLVRSGVYHGATAVRRWRAHRTVARALQGARAPAALERYAWHLSESGADPDEEVAAALTKAASGGPASLTFPLAARLYAHAARFTPDDEGKALRLLAAARAAQAAGSLDESADLLDRALDHASHERTRLELRQLRCYVDIQRGRPARAREQLRSAVDEARRVDPSLAAVMLGGITLTELAIGDLTAARATSAESMQLADAFGDAAAALPVRLLHALVELLGGNAEDGRALLHDLEKPLAVPDLSFPYPVSGVGGLCYLATEELDQGHALLDRAVHAARSSSTVGLLAHLLGTLSVVEFWRGEWNASLAHADESVRLGEDTGRVIEVCRALAAQARTEAVLGREADCRSHEAQCRSLAAAAELPMDAARARGALGLLELGLGRYEDAATHLEEVRAFSLANGRGDGLYLSWAADLAEAYVHLHRTDEAYEVLRVLDHEAGRGRRPITAAAAARCRGMLEPAYAERHMDRALAELGDIQAPFERGRTDFACGELLRRLGRRSEARRRLQRALATFDRLGAAGWAGRAAAELHAAGGDRVDSGPTPLDGLTPQELRVALAVGRGVTNHEAAEQLFLSVKTVEFHLGNIYRKLDGVHRRAQLVRLLSESARP
ncbi:AAA family ATPase [Streptomyces sp. NBC_00006]|uniref:helix-turn-helix transcriptional regulator n=1 Tax=unclassified Streptomyces TaxID=2593676 RepID=UPI0022594B6D|nr:MULTISPECIES: LuxR family transcriptional regulator [unclassified Streptomyces]MCX4831513.1 AAA family ATPase [Streptomyces sp. NBC_01016]MCX5536035.1 AAA family ATPase [Streptomyces sp. NBC_00006]